MMMVVLLPGLVWAQQDQKAKEILNKVSEKTRSFQSIVADFSIAMTNVEADIDEKIEGTIKIKGQKYHVDVPVQGVTIICNGETLWNYMKDGNQVMISNLEDAESDLMDPSALFTLYEKGFSSKYLKQEKQNGVAVHVIELIPDTDEYDVSKIILTIKASDYMIHSATLYGSDGNLYAMKVNKIDTKQNLKDSDFVFDKSKYSDVDEIDLR